MNRAERFRAKWTPVRAKKTRQSKKLEPGSDSIRTDKALAIALFCLLQAAAVSASLAAEDPSIEPGQWKVTSETRMNGATMPQGVKARCYTPEQAGNVIKTFGPTSDTVNSTCAPAVFETTEKTMKWRLQCKGQLDIDITGDFRFNSRTHYTATVSSKGWMAGALISDVKTEITGERIGDCQ